MVMCCERGPSVQVVGGEVDDSLAVKKVIPVLSRLAEDQSM